MTTQEFIEKTYNTTNDKWGKYGTERRCSSVLTDKHGTVYSYGYHYPLAFKVGGIDWVNEAGYSSTTNKHISWAKRALGYHNYVGVKLHRADAQVIASEFSTEGQKIEAIRNALEREIKSIIEVMDSKKRKDTAIYSLLEADLHRARVAYARTLA